MMKKLFLVISTFLLLLSLSVGTASAKVLLQEKGNITVGKTEVINDDLFIGSESVDLNGTVNGDVFVGAGTVNVTGTINGNLIIGGGSVTITGTVKNDIYVAGGNVSIQSTKIGGSVVAGTGTLLIDDKSTIGGTLVAGAGNLNNKAVIGRNVMIGGGSVNLDSKISGEARIGAGELILGPNTKIGKDLLYMIDNGKKELVIPTGASVAGEVKKIEPSTKVTADLDTAKKDMNAFAKTAGNGFKVISFLGALLVGMLSIKFFGTKVSTLSSQATKFATSSFGTGFLVMILIVPAAIILAITIIGFPLAWILVTFFILGLYFAKIIVSLAIGEWISSKMHWNKLSVYVSFAMGLALFFIFRSVPVLGFFVGFVVNCIGLGAIVLLLKSKK